MKSDEIRKRFLAFFEKRGHTIIPSASLVPENDPSVLFNTAGMQPLVPYLLGAEHPAGKRLANIQKCVRTGDLDDIGDNRHLSFFEMMGNWSLGDYFKNEAIAWSFEFLTSKEEGLGLDPNRLYVTVFEGDENASLDEESRNIWMSLGIPEHRIYALGAEDNWWSAGDNGPCGPDSEMFYDMQGNLGDLSKEDFLNAIKEETVVEIWNDVFMEYKKENGRVVGKLAQKNVDTGAGLERITAVMQGKKTAYDTDLFEGIIGKIRELSKNSDEKAERIVADHIRTAVFMIADGVTPSNTDRGYVLRKLIRRMITNIEFLGFDIFKLIELSKTVTTKYRNTYTEVNNDLNIENILKSEIEKTQLIDSEIIFEKEFDKLMSDEGRSPLVARDRIPGKTLEFAQPFIPDHLAYRLYTEKGIPKEKIIALANRKGYILNIEGFNELMDKHRTLSRAGAEQKFKGGLAGTGEMETKYHTATHLLHQALRDVLGPEVAQKGSNITSERLRFDFAFPRKMTDEEKQEVEDIVNEKITAALPMQKVTLPKEEAEKTGALHFFGDKYGDSVNVYFIGHSLEDAYSKEFCGGPHVSNTSELGTFKISKEEAVSAGVRRIKAVLY